MIIRFRICAEQPRRLDLAMSEIDRIKKENRQLRSVLAKLIWISDRKHDVLDLAKQLLPKCPECGSYDYIKIDIEGDSMAPESTYFLCNDCGYASEPE